MRPRRLILLPALLALSLTTAGAASRCKLMMLPPVPIKMENLRPVITASVNGTDAQFLVDTGSFWDFLSPAAAAEFNLPLSTSPLSFHISGVGGSFVPRVATVNTFVVDGMSAHRAQFLVGDNDFRGGVDGILGESILGLADVEFDFANGTLRFVKPQHCGSETLAYWATTQPIGVVDLRWMSEQQTRLIATASVNGHDIAVLFDTGAARTVLSLSAARRAGITPDSPGVVPAGEWYGLGQKTFKVWAAPVAKFEIGGESIEHARVLIGDFGFSNTDMLLGADFFLAHHVYVALSQDKLYFTYNGGPVFDLAARRPAPTANRAQAGAASPPAASAPPGNAPQPSASPSSGTQAGSAPESSAAPASAVPADAADLIRRGMAETSRGEFSPAVADLTRACQIAPTDADCRYQRGLTYWRNREPQLALADFNAALALDPKDFQAHLARAWLELPKLHAGIEDDLDAVDRLAPPEADLRLALGNLYHAIEQYAAAVHQYDLWIEYHGDDLRLGHALGTRCGLQAGANIDLDRALDDCDRALSLLPRSDRGPVLSNRSCVYLRLGQFDRAIADATASIRLRPQSAYPLYLRGLAQLRKGLTAQGQADLAAAQKLQPDIARHYATMGLTP